MAVMSDLRARTAETTRPEIPAHPEILIVDDDAGTRRLLSASLESAGFTVRTAASGEEALHAIGEKPPDVMVLDYEMPGLNGAEVCRRVRASEKVVIKELPVIMVTAHTAESEEIDCLEAGANDFVTKPVSRAVLQARIHTRLRLRAYARELERWREVQEADLAAARVTQQAIIPAALPELSGWKVEARFEPLIQVGGDIYGWEPQRDGQWLFWLADGTGHGTAAALLTALTAHLFHKASETLSSPAKILWSVNREFLRLAAGATFMTACCVVVATDGAMRFAGAGHPPLLVQRRDGSVEAFASERTMLGVGENPELHDVTLHLDRGETALLYTDGLYDRHGKSGGRFTHETMQQTLCLRPLGEDAIADLVARIDEQADETPTDDDLAVIALRRHG